MKTETISINAPDATKKAVNVLTAGGVIAFPTDTIYGLAALSNNSTAIQKLFKIKGRHQSKAIAVLIGSFLHLETVGNLSDNHHKESAKTAQILARYFWPGALTLVIPRHPDLPDILSPYPTIGVRMPKHPELQSLLQITGPLATTSANLSGEANPISPQQVMAQLEGRIHLLLDGGQTPGPTPSTVVDCTLTPPLILRQGAIPIENLKEVLPSLDYSSP